MAWITLTLRKQSLKSQVTELNNESVQLSRQQRSVHRHLSYEESAFDTAKKSELRKAKSAYLKIRNERPDVDSEEYEEWKVEYSAAQEDYQAQKQDIEDYYDDVKEEDSLNEQVVKYSFDPSFISSIFDGTSDLFQFLTASIKIFPPAFLNILLAFFGVFHCSNCYFIL